jgi:AraC-like DNA-binding protein
MADKYFEIILEKCNITRAELFSGFENRFGIGIDNYIELRKLTIAKENLRFTTKSEEDVAKSIGINDLQNFRAIFYKHENCSPEEYRRCWAQWIRK